ncbi:MAG: SDR family NAD(P)-dependent oxidoreductase, partial [Chloroflexota bacterium]
SPQIDIVSNVYGRFVESEMGQPDYWLAHIRQTVRFTEGVDALRQSGANIFVEVGPQPTLLSLAQQCFIHHIQSDETAEPTSDVAWLPSLRQHRDTKKQMLLSLGQMYMHGLAIDWTTFENSRNEPRKKIVLPTYPFQRQRFWIDQNQTTAGHHALRPLLDRMMRLPEQHQIIFESLVDLKRWPFLEDHQVYDVPISPGACHVAMFLNAAMLLWPTLLQDESTLTLQDVVFSAPLVIPPEMQRTTQLIFTQQTEPAQTLYEGKLLSFAAQEAEKSDTTIHATGTVSRYTETSLTPVDIAALRHRCPISLSDETFYTRLSEQQIRLGPTFRWVKQIWRSEAGEAVGEIGHPDNIAFNNLSGGYLLPPSIIDACFQVASVAGDVASDEGVALVPFAVSALHVYHPLQGNRWWVNAKQTGPQMWNIQLLDDTGVILAAIEGFELRAASPQLVQTGDVWTNWLHTVTWQAQSLEPQPSSSDILTEQSWLLFCDTLEVGEAIAERLRQQGQSPIVVYAGESYQQVSDHQFTLRPTASQDYEQLVAALPPLTHVIYLWGLDTLTPASNPIDDLQSSAESICGSLLHLLQALAQAQTTLTGLWLVTGNSQAVSNEPQWAQVNGLIQTTLWGLQRVIALEHPEFSSACFDLELSETSFDGKPISDEQIDQFWAEIQYRLTDQAVEDQIAWRDDQRYVARLAPLETEMQSAPIYDPESTYLITGGLGGLGLAMTHHIVKQGAKQVMLLGRSAPDAEVQAQIDLLNQQAMVTVCQADVTNSEQIATLLESIDPSYPLRGVIHAAGALSDGILLQQSWVKFSDVFAAKVRGAWTLHQLTEALPLDFFILFSTTTAVLGNRGQANHAAANAFMDALAHYRHAQGLPALTINWGAWDTIGAAVKFVEENGVSTRVPGQGLITPEQGIAIFEQLAAQSKPQAGVFPIEWNAYLEAHRPDWPFLAAVNQRASQISRPSVSDIRQQLQQTSPDERKQRLLQHLQEAAAKVLGISDTTAVDPHHGLMSLGLDSLMAIELRNHLTRSLGQQLPAVLIFNYPTLDKLADYLIQLLFPTDSHSSTPINLEAITISTSDDDVTAEDIDQLSDDDVLGFISDTFQKYSSD